LHKKHPRFLLFISLSVQKCTKKISPPAIITPNQKTYVTCKVTNTGKRAGNQGTVNHIIDNELSTFWEGNKGDSRSKITSTQKIRINQRCREYVKAQNTGKADYSKNRSSPPSDSA
ncbi:hypothetical protein, partial [Bacteroides finegoldii]|uniref:hypothetical protein n=1 Tax=Bacteroides finegoldii TaxID=338188 RepID=UPI0018AA26D2